MTVSVTAGLQAALAYAFIPPQGDLQLEVFRVHAHTLTNLRRIWNGLVTGPSYAGGLCRFRLVSRMQLLVKRTFPRRVFQALCGHKLGDEFCTVDTDTLKVTTTVLSVDGRDIVTSAPARRRAHPDVDHRDSVLFARRAPHLPRTSGPCALLVKARIPEYSLYLLAPRGECGLDLESLGHGASSKARA